MPLNKADPAATTARGPGSMRRDARLLRHVANLC